MPGINLQGLPLSWLDNQSQLVPVDIIDDLHSTLSNHEADILGWITERGL